MPCSTKPQKTHTDKIKFQKTNLKFQKFNIQNLTFNILKIEKFKPKKQQLQSNLTRL